MSLKPFFGLLRDGRLSALLSVGAGLKSFYKLTYLAAAGEYGLLCRLANGPATLNSLAEALNLWGAATRGAGRLPAEDELVDQLRQAGYSSVKTKNLVPGERFMSFQAFRG